MPNTYIRDPKDITQIFLENLDNVLTDKNGDVIVDKNGDIITIK